jgi:two-component system chemotaxis sensor kinase CheA
MNEFIGQFILESRDYIEQASAGLMVLEQKPTDADTLDSVFRAFHTLKGGASIVDFTAMERAVHAAEDVLSRARAGKDPLTRELIEACLACLDQTSRWLDSMEATEAAPVGADLDADRILDRFQQAGRHQASPARIVNQAEWLDSLLLGHPALSDTAKSALRFTPRSASFFQGEDPLALIESLPGLLWLDLEPIDTWPALDALDPFESMLMITALTSSPARVVADHFQQYQQECEIVGINTEQTHGDGALLGAARKLIEAQIALLDVASPEALEGCLRSAGTVVANAIRHGADREVPDTLAAAIDESLRARDTRALRASIDALLGATQAKPVAVREPTSHQASNQDLTIGRTLRVEAERVDALVRLTGELTTVKNAIGHAIKLQQEMEHTLAGPLKDHHAVLDHLVAELQRAVLAIRVLPLRTVLQRFPRVVREMSENLGKPVKLTIEGEETEADKAIVEMLFEPLLHVVRNAMDHGIEAPGLRERSGKSAVALIRMRASRHGANVMVEVQDDGSGVNVERVREVALERGVANAEALQTMSDAEIVDLIFAPGFSTATRVTALSGRGVGMDAVRSAVERVGGRVSIDSHPGESTSVTMTLPFSVMMTHVMTVEAGGQMFGIPLDAVVETIRVPTRDISGIGAAKALVHRDRTLPIIELSKVLSVQNHDQAVNEVVIVIAAIAGSLAGIQVDRLGERMEVMLKPLEGLLADVPGLTGTTILGDGRVLLVLDLGGVLQ